MITAQDVAWFEKYRPNTIDDMLFESEEQERLCRNIIEQGPKGNILLYGPPGTGKTTFARIIIRTFIKSEHDIFKCSKRSVTEIDEVIKWIPRVPFQSPFKIVYIEEIDKLSREAQTTLKDGAMERNIVHTKFIATTNWVEKLDVALVSRFDTKLHFSGKYDKAKLKVFLGKVLQNENAKYDEQKLEEFISRLGEKVDMRSLLSNLQIAYIKGNGSINFDEIQAVTCLEDDVVNLILKIVKKVSDLPHSDRYRCCLYPMSSPIMNEYSELVTRLSENLQYETIFSELYDRLTLFPLKVIVGKYQNDMYNKRHLDLHLLACLYELLRCLTSLFE